MFTVIIADHQPVFRLGIANILSMHEIRIVGQPDTPEQLLQALTTQKPRVLVLASGFAPRSLSEVRRAASLSQTAILMLCDITQRSEQYIRKGMQGVLFRSASANLLVDVVRRLASGGSFLHSSPSDTGDSSDMVGERAKSRLRPDELRMIAAVLQGYSSSEMAYQFGKSTQVVKNSLQRIFEKLGVSGRLELALFVMYHRIVAEAVAKAGQRTRTNKVGSDLTTPAPPQHDPIVVT
jgi:DNA-binding NarL/FixJ family response regulator